MEHNTLQPAGEERLFNRYFITVWFATLFIYFGHCMMNSTLTLYVKHLGYNASVNGLVGIPYAILAVTGRIVGGYVCDKKSRRLVLACGCLLFSLSVWCFGQSTAVWALMLFRGCHGGGYGLAYTAMSTANVDVTPEKKRREGIGIFFVANAIAFAASGSIVLALSRGGSFTPAFGVISGLLGLGFLIALILCNYEKKPFYQAKKAASAVAVPEKGLRRYFEPSALVPGLVLLCLVAGATGASYYALTYASDMGFSNAGLYFTIAAVIMAICNLSQARLVRRFGPLPLLVITFSFLALTLILQAITQSPVVYFLQGAAFGVQQGFGWPVAFSLAMEQAPYNRRGAASSTTCMMVDIGAGIGGVVYGQAITHIGYNAFYFALAGTQLAGLLIALIVVRRRSAAPQP